jgi:hypothetical protein
MSIYNSSADIAKQQLDEISPTMCFAKWAQVSMHFTNGMTHSCYHPPLHKMDLEEVKLNPSALHNTKQKKFERKLMLEGQRPQGCSYCWKIEDVGGRSDRIYRSGEYWAQNAKEDIALAGSDGDIVPRYLEVNFNQACNFKCMYCSPHLSTAWEEEVKQLGPFKISMHDKSIVLHNDLDPLTEVGLMPLKQKQNQNTYLEAFWKWWPKLYRKLEVFRITGGEPLMDINLYKILDYIYENPNSWLELSITSNLCPPKPELFSRFLDKLKKLEEIKIWEDKERFNPGSGNHWYVNMPLKNFALFVSIDSVGDQAEYIRTGLNFNVLENNLYKFLNETMNTTVTFINTFNALSVPRITDFMGWVLELRRTYSKTNQGTKSIKIHDINFNHPDHNIHPRQKIWFDIPLLRKPNWQAIQILPKEFDIYLIEAIEFMKANQDVSDFAGFYDFEIAKMERNLKIMQERNMSEHELNTNRKNFYHFFEQFDNRRGTNFAQTFPEMEEFYKNCKG